MKNVIAIALNTFRETIRDRILYAAIVLGLGLVLFSLILAQLAHEERARIVFDVGLAAVSLLSIFMCVFLTSSTFHQEIERKTLYGILSRDVHRYEFILGKWVGICASGVNIVALLGALHFAIVAHAAGASLALIFFVFLVFALFTLGLFVFARIGASLALPLSIAAYLAAASVAGSAGADAQLLLTLHLLVAGEIALVIALVLFFSSFSMPLTSAILSVGVFMIGRSADAMASMKSKAIPEVIQDLLRGLSWIAPNLNLFNPGRTILIAERSAGGLLSYLGTTLGYGLLYSVILLILAALFFNRRDLP